MLQLEWLFSYCAVEKQFHTDAGGLADDDAEPERACLGHDRGGRRQCQESDSANDTYGSLHRNPPRFPGTLVGNGW